MSASLEWTEWHLTNTGWVRGTQKTDTNMTHVSYPEGVVATFTYSEEISYFGRPDCKTSEPTIEDSLRADFEAAILKFGQCPQRL